MQCVVSSHQELSGNTQYAVIAPVCVKLRSSVHFVHPEQKITSTTPQHNREHNRAPCLTAPPPMPPTKAMGAITQNRRGRPTATPWSTSWYSGVVRFRWARERRHRLLGCIFWAKFVRRGALIPWPNCDGRTKLDSVSLSKKSTLSQLTVGGLFVFGESAVGWNGSPVCGNGN